MSADDLFGFYGAGTPSHGPDGEYGIAYRHGLLSEHEERFLAAGGRVIAAGSGKRWAVVGTGRAVPVVCSEIIAVRTEDGPSDGRCGLDVAADGMCESHAEEFARWMADAP